MKGRCLGSVVVVWRWKDGSEPGRFPEESLLYRQKSNQGTKRGRNKIEKRLESGGRKDLCIPSAFTLWAGNAKQAKGIWEKGKCPLKLPAEGNT